MQFNVCVCVYLNIGDAPDEILRWLLARIRAQPPIGLGLQATIKAHETTKRTAFYVSAPTNMYVPPFK